MNRPNFGPPQPANAAPPNIEEDDFEEVSLREYYETILRYRHLVISVTLIAFVFAISLHFFLPKKYSAQALLIRTDSVGKNDQSFLSSLLDKGSSMDLETLQQIAKSQSVLENALLKIHGEIEKYQKEGYKISKEEMMLINEHTTTKSMAGVVSISNHKNSDDIIKIKTTMNGAPHLTSAISNSVSEALLEHIIENRKKKVETQIHNLKMTIANNNRDIEQTENELKLVLDPTEGITLNDNDSKTSREFEHTELRLDEAKLSLKEVTDQIRNIKVEFDILGQPLEKIHWIDTSSALHNKLKMLKFQREELLTRYKPANPSVKKIDNQIESLSETLRPKGEPGTIYIEVDRFRMPMVSNLMQLQAKKAAIENKVAFLEKDLENTSRRLLEAPQEQKQARDLQNKLNMMDRVHLELHKSLYQAQMILLATSNEFEINDRATPSTRSSSPGMVKISIVGAILGLALSIAIAFILNNCESTLKSTTDLKRHLTYSALGAIPKWDDENKYIDEMVPDSNLAEVYGILRNNVRFSNVAQPEKCLLVASPIQNEGKSLTSINLALSFALEGSKVLLVSADLRRPFSHTRFRKVEDRRKSLGMVEYLEEKTELEDVIYESNFTNFSFIPTCARASNPAYLLKKDRFKEMLKYAQSHYEVVIVDSPAVLPVVDATIITPMVRGVLLVARANQSPISAVKDTIQRLEHVGSPIVGISLNMIKDLKLELFYGYGNAKYSGYNA